jgi:TetR/AcrR family transcriptional regulator, transcriptional repressor for nem operon
MPYPPAHREQVKDNILRSAQTLFNRRGFAAVSIDEVMSEAGLTRGSFYSYFKSKSDLYAQAVSRIVCEKQDGANGGNGRLHADQIIRDYLSHQHFENIDGGCPMIGLPSDISRSDKSVREAFESALRLMVEIFERDMQQRLGGGAHERALASAALCVGGMVLARSIEDRALADELRGAALTTALSLGKWQ